MKKFFFLTMLLVSTFMQAQTIEGDMNEDGRIGIDDITMLIEEYLEWGG